MKNILFVFAFLLFSANIYSQEPLKKDALELEIKSEKGKQTTLGEVIKSHKGKPILIDIWATWCPDCIKGMPKVHDLQNQFKNDVVYLFLSFDRTEEAWIKGIEKYKVNGENYLILSDWKTGKLKAAIDLDWIPRYILVDKNGKIAHYRAIEADDQELITKIKELTK